MLKSISLLITLHIEFYCLAAQQSDIPSSSVLSLLLAAFNFNSSMFLLVPNLDTRASSDLVQRVIMLGGSGKFIRGSNGTSCFHAHGKIIH